MLLDVEHDPVACAAVTIAPVECHDGSESWVEDEVTIDVRAARRRRRGPATATAVALLLAAVGSDRVGDDGRPAELVPVQL